MDMKPEIERKLIKLLAARLPAWEARHAVVQKSGLKDAQLTGSPAESWSMLIKQARSQQRLEDFLWAAAKQAPGDKHLRIVAQSAVEGQIRFSRWATVIRVLATVLAVGLCYQLWGLLPGDSSHPQDASEPIAAADAPAQDEKEVEVLTAEVVEKAPEPVEAVATKPVVTPKPVAKPRVAAKPQVAAKPTSTKHTSQPGDWKRRPCAEPAGKVVGYAYGGDEPLEVKNGVWVAPFAVNVRKEYPSEKNGFSKASERMCGLFQGTQVTVTDALVEVPGGAWWVPVRGGAAYLPDE